MLTYIEKILQTYDLDEILELNDRTIEDLLEHCIDSGFIKLPNPKPVDLYE